MRMMLNKRERKVVKNKALLGSAKQALASRDFSNTAMATMKAWAPVKTG